MSGIQTWIVWVVLLGFVIAPLPLNAATPAQQGMPGWPSLCNYEPGIASGGAYQLASVAWDVSGMSSGGDYRLQGSVAPRLRGSGCCCTYLPLTLRNAP